MVVGNAVCDKDNRNIAGNSGVKRNNNHDNDNNNIYGKDNGLGNDDDDNDKDSTTSMMTTG